MAKQRRILIVNARSVGPQILLGVAAGIIGALIVGLILGRFGSLKELLINSDVLGATIGASITIVGAIGVDRLLKARQEREHRRELFTAVDLISTAINQMIRDRGPRVPTHYAKLHWRKMAFDDLYQRFSAHSALVTLCYHQLNEAWAHEYHPLSQIAQDAALYEEAPEHYTVIEGSEQIRDALENLTILLGQKRKS